MEVKDLVSFYIDDTANMLEVSFRTIDDDGNSSLHLMAKYKYTNILKKCLEKLLLDDSDILYLINGI